MKFFHWDKQCKQEIERLNKEIKQLMLVNSLGQESYKELEIKNQIAHQGITINEKVSEELRTKVAQLEIENKYLKAQLANATPEQGTIIYQAPELKEQSKKKRIEAK